jgi:anti-anti-sigma regulatory factor
VETVPSLLFKRLVADTIEPAFVLNSTFRRRDGKGVGIERKIGRMIGTTPYLEEQENNMSLDVAHYPEEDRIDIKIEGSLDLTLTNQILDVCRLVDAGVVICVIDATRVRRVFDSGLAVLILLMNRLAQYRVKLVILGDIAGLMHDTLPESLRSIQCVSNEGLPA